MNKKFANYVRESVLLSGQFLTDLRQ